MKPVDPIPSGQSAENAAYYDHWASVYDRYPNPTVAADELEFPARYAHLQGKSVLEIGCGTGRHTSRLLAQGNRVVGVDLSPGMLAEARKKFAGQAFEPVLGDFLVATAVPLASVNFDAIIVSLVLEHVADLGAFFEKAARLLVRGGQLFASEIHPARANAGIKAHFRDPESQVEFHAVSFPHTEDDFRAAASAACFDIEEIFDVVGDERLLALNEAWGRYQNLPMIQIWRLKSPS